MVAVAPTDPELAHDIETARTRPATNTFTAGISSPQDTR